MIAQKIKKKKKKQQYIIFKLNKLLRFKGAGAGVPIEVANRVIMKIGFMGFLD